MRGEVGATGAAPVARNGQRSDEAEAVLRMIRTRRSHPFVLRDEPPREVIDTLLELAAYWRSNGTGLDQVREHLGFESGSQVLGFVYVGYPDPAGTLLDK